MEQIEVHNKIFYKLVQENVIISKVNELAAEINNQYRNNTPPVFLCVLNGAFMFASDLMKNIQFNHYLTFIKLSSYIDDKSSGEVKTIMGLDIDLKDKDVIILEDIIDTGLTIRKTADLVKKAQPRSVKVATAFLKKETFDHKTVIDFKGLEVPNHFLIGYGLDYNGLGRNLRHLYHK